MKNPEDSERVAGKLPTLVVKGLELRIIASLLVFLSSCTKKKDCASRARARCYSWVHVDGTIRGLWVDTQEGGDVCSPTTLEGKANP